ncbi:hypothetical protein GW17_00002696 [Ensete ventricosum]|nr:hypothetical protein GW17_00002696 [Ensete ventricosum]
MTDRQQSRRGCPRCLLQAKHVSIGFAEGWEHVVLTCDKNPWMPVVSFDFSWLQFACLTVRLREFEIALEELLD